MSTKKEIVIERPLRLFVFKKNKQKKYIIKIDGKKKLFDSAPEVKRFLLSNKKKFVRRKHTVIGKRKTENEIKIDEEFRKLPISGTVWYFPNELSKEREPTQPELLKNISKGINVLASEYEKKEEGAKKPEEVAIYEPPNMEKKNWITNILNMMFLGNTEEFGKKMEELAGVKINNLEEIKKYEEKTRYKIK